MDCEKTHIKIIIACAGFAILSSLYTLLPIRTDLFICIFYCTNYSFTYYLLYEISNSYNLKKNTLVKLCKALLVTRLIAEIVNTVYPISDKFIVCFMIVGISLIYSLLCYSERKK